MNVRRVEFVAWLALCSVMLLVGFVYIAERRKPQVILPVLAQSLDFGLTNQFGVAVRNSDLDGYVAVVDVIFSRCPGQCHRLSQQMRRLQQSMKAGAPVRLISLTADPEYDTPDVLRRYSERYGAEGSTWLFLTGSKQEVYRWAQRGLKFSVIEGDPAKVSSLEDMFIHSAAFAVLDARGRLRAMIQSEDSDSTERVLETVRLLLMENSR